jgi:arsenate reductase
MLPGQLNRRHWDFDDPAHPLDTDDEKLKVFRRMRDEIKKVFEAYAAGRRDQSQPQKKLASTNISL